MSNTDRTKLIEQIRELVAENELEQACQLLQQLSDVGYQLHSSLVDSKRRYAIDVVSDDVYKRETNKISMGILEELQVLATKSPQSLGHDGNKASSDDVKDWTIALARPDGNNWREMARIILEKWRYSPESQGIGNRKWGRQKVGKDEVAFRIWGLFNLRPRNTKWLWIAWDDADRKIVMVKELNPNFEDRDERVSNKIKWEIATYRQLKEARVKGLLNIIDHGEKWFASSLEPYGSLRWQVVGGEEDISGSPVYSILRGEKGRKGLYQQVRDLKDAPDKENWPVYRSIFVQTLDILAELHAHGYVYRDLHRANILLSEYDAKSKTIRVKLCDFDSNRKIDGEEPPFYLDEQFKGPYIAPERLERPDQPNEDATKETWQKYYSDLEAYHGLPSSDVYGMVSIIANILLDKSNQVLSGQELVHVIESKGSWRKDFRNMMLRALAGKDSYANRPTASEFARFLEKVPYESIRERRSVLPVYLLLFLAALLAIFVIRPFFQPGDEKYVVLGDTGPVILDGDQLHWTGNKPYRIENDIYVVDETLRIDPGIQIYVKGNYGIYITRNARIEATGTADQPIVFTTYSLFDEVSTPADYQHWKGLILYGQAPIGGLPDSIDQDNYDEFRGSGPEELHRAGGDLPDHSSGTLQYVRVEYAGFCRDDHTQFNALTLIGVGRETIIDYFSALHSEDDGIEVIGGKVNLRHIICYNFADDAIDWEHGWNGKAQYLVAVGGALGGDLCIEYAEKPSRTGDSEKASSLFNIGNFDELDVGTGPQVKNVTAYLRGDTLSDMPFLRFESTRNFPVFQDILLQGFVYTSTDSLIQFSEGLLEEFPEIADSIRTRYAPLLLGNSTALPPYAPATPDFLIPTKAILSTGNLITDPWFEPSQSNFQGAFRNPDDKWHDNRWGRLE